jgi:hypothetical protein
LLLDEAGVGMAGPNTALGDAIGLTIKLLAAAKEQEKVLILLTDGNDTGSAITPEHAARLAREHGIVVHAIGIGDPAATGEDKVDLHTLQMIARTTGGRFFRADDRAALQQVYATLDQITPHNVTTLSHQPRRDLFVWPLGGPGRAAARPGPALLVPEPLRPRSPEHGHRPRRLALLAPLVAVAGLPGLGLPLLWRRRRDLKRQLRGIIAPHLVEHLLIRPRDDRRLRPVHLLAALLVVGALAAAGPPGSRTSRRFSTTARR